MEDNRSLIPTLAYLSNAALDILDQRSNSLIFEIIRAEDDMLLVLYNGRFAWHPCLLSQELLPYIIF